MRHIPSSETGSTGSGGGGTKILFGRALAVGRPGPSASAAVTSVGTAAGAAAETLVGITAGSTAATLAGASIGCVDATLVWGSIVDRRVTAALARACATAVSLGGAAGGGGSTKGNGLFGNFAEVGRTGARRSAVRLCERTEKIKNSNSL